MIWIFVLAFFLPLIWADCPPGTIYGSNFNKCYKFVNQPTGFLAAEQTCQGLGGHLVALGNAFETSFVVGFVLQQDPSVKSFWIGANYLLTSSWSWTYNVSYSYSNWAPGQPADPSINQCGAVRDSDNFWTKELCNSQKPFVCSFDPNAAPVGSPTCPPCLVQTSTPASTTCPPGTIYGSNFNKCYKFVNQPTGFLAAEQTCQGLGGHLVALGNAFETSFVVGFVLQQDPSVKSFWIGANYLLTSSWSWTYNVSYSYSNWAPGQPADPSINQCGAVRDSDNFWTKELCNSQKPFVCSFDPNAAPVGSPTCPPCLVQTSTPASTTCPPGTIYGSNFNKCYKFVNQPTSFLAAEQTCQGLGGHLVALGNAFETSFVVGFVLQQDPSVKSFWIGANYLLTSSWSWTYNVSYSYSNWAPGQPADPSINQCGAVRGSDSYWTKELCNSQKPFVCSFDPNAAPVGSPTCPPCLVQTSTLASTTCPPEPTGNLTCSGRCSGNYTQSPIDCKCYHWYPRQLLSFNDSQTFCQSHSGSLIKITSAAQNTWLTNWLDNKLSSFPWIGLSCPGATKDVCRWADGSPLTCYDNFDTWPVYQYEQIWNGLNPGFFLRLNEFDADFGTWLRSDESYALTVVCMRG